ncbi:hypothetical protein [Vagococcus jeotgali]|uniref:hypothetical protein n=1 Tax=Vagococcus jeotgali TaxID=3109030 RepID=UPI002DDA02C1|nr:hypothetical protein [Vagococcus sp. B2T-5]
MSKAMVTVDSFVDSLTVHSEEVVGRVEVILENTVLIRDEEDDTHLVLKSTLIEEGYSVDEQTHSYRSPYRRR